MLKRRQYKNKRYNKYRTLHKVEWQGYNTKLACDNIFIVVQTQDRNTENNNSENNRPNNNTEGGGGANK